MFWLAGCDKIRNHGLDMRTKLKLLAPAILVALIACNSIKPEPTRISGRANANGKTIQIPKNADV